MWDLSPGEEDSRTAIQNRHGGSPSRGISAPSRESPNDSIMLWWRPERGEAHGYSDGWTSDGVFNFTGTGQNGDQIFEAPHSENGRLRDHQVNGDQVRLLKYMGPNRVQYQGELQLDPDDPWQYRDGSDSRGLTRRMIQFRFLSVDDRGTRTRGPTHKATARLDRQPELTDLSDLAPVPTTTELEGLQKRSFLQNVMAQQRVARRTEGELVHAFGRWLATSHGISCGGLRIPYLPERRELRGDLFVPQTRVLFEAKSSTSREHLRMALGQLLDYRRWLPDDHSVAVLLPTSLTEDMASLLADFDVGWAHRTKGDNFELSSTSLIGQ